MQFDIEFDLTHDLFLKDRNLNLNEYIINYIIFIFEEFQSLYKFFGKTFANNIFV